MTDETLDGADAPSEANDFAAQIIRQLYADLDGVLFDDEENAADDAYALITQAVRAGRTRGAVPLVLTRAALVAHREMMGGEALADAAAIEAAGDALVAMLPIASAQLPALQAQAARLTQYLGIAEQSNEPIHLPLARAMHRFCAALGEEDAVTGSRALFELRSLVVHLDACANAIDLAGAAPEPLRVIRPDRFHDYFMHYTALAQKPENAGGEAAVATLTQDGRISAVITEDTHPLEAAARAVRDMISGDETTRDHVLARIRALLDFMDQLRREPRPLIGDALNDTNVHLSLVIAAATAPLHASAGFSEAAISQVARYNQTLLRSTAAPAAKAH